jgi:hypothetical protein
MRTKTINIYSASELKEHNPEGFERAHEQYKQDCYSRGNVWTDEIMESLKAVFKASGINLRDWSIDGYGYSYVKFDMETETGDLAGTRAQAWLENNLLADLRIGYNAANRWELSQYGSYYRAGKIAPCPFTGVCYDEDFLNALVESVNGGDSIEEAYSSLASVSGKLFASEWEDQLSEEYFTDYADANEWEYDEDGNQL